MFPELLEAAFYVCQGRSYAAFPQQTIAELEKQFPECSTENLKSALVRGDALISAACDWAEQVRGPNNDGSGRPTIVLKDVCPGFSPAVYAAAESRGLYLTK